MVTSASEVFLSEHLVCNQAALSLNKKPQSFPFIDSKYVRREFSIAQAPFGLMLIRRMHIAFMSNIKLRVWAPKQIPDDEDNVVFGDGSSNFHSSSYQRYAMTFE